MTMRRLSFVAAHYCFSVLVLMACVAGARAADICEAVALRDVPAIENSDSILKRGEHDTAITQYRVNKETGTKSFCSHGGYCYPAESLRLTNCAIDKTRHSENDGIIFYELVVTRSKVPAPMLKYDDLDNRLLRMGLCSACADNATSHYINQPNSPCGQLVKGALAGNPTATAKLKEFPDYCWGEVQPVGH